MPTVKGLTEPTAFAVDVSALMELHVLVWHAVPGHTAQLALVLLAANKRKRRTNVPNTTQLSRAKHNPDEMLVI